MRRPRGDGGTTLVELLVVMVLLGIVGSIVATWQLSMQRTTAGVSGFVSDQADLRTAMAYMTKDLRMAIRPTAGVPAFLAGSQANDVQFYVNTGAGSLTLVRYLRENTGTGTARLVREESPAAQSPTASATWPTSGTRRTVLVQQLLTSEPLATYYRAPSEGQAACAAPGGSCETPVTLSPYLSAPDEIGAVVVQLAARTKSSSVGRSELRTRVTVVNAGLTAIAD